MNKKEYRNILNNLEYAYIGAKSNDDVEMMVRITRAVAAFELDTSKDCIIANTEE